MVGRIVVLGGFILASNIQKEFKVLVGKIKSRKFRAKIRKLIEDAFKQFKHAGGLNFFNSPAGKSHHHSYAGGLIQHTLSTVKIAMGLVEVLEKVYGWKKINRDYVLAGALIHDLYKPPTYVLREDGTYEISSLGEKLDHLTLLLNEAYKKGFPEDFLHVLAASHGEAGPTTPKTIEALIVHLADYVDSRLMGEIQRAYFSLTRKCLGEIPTKISPKEALEVIYAKQVGGCEKVKKVFRKVEK